MQSWQEQLLTFDNDTTRKVGIQSNVNNVNPADLSIAFKSFQAGEFIVYYIKLFYIKYYKHYSLFYFIQVILRSISCLVKPKETLSFQSIDTIQKEQAYFIYIVDMGIALC